MRAEPVCKLLDCTLEYFSDEEGWLPAVPGEMHTAQEVVDYLRAAAARRPHMVRMDLPGRLCAMIAIGGPLGAVDVCHLISGRYVPQDHPPSWCAVADRPPPVEYVSFLTEGSTAADDIAAEHLLPAEEVIQIAAHLAAHRVLPRTHAWMTHDGRGNAIYAGREQRWEDWDKPIHPHRQQGDVPF